ncbi:MAG: hypothetical protein IT464_12870 [Planctomycetes bacterium]|nr:hypothetical protein [Planctomycetota bacterium]
MRQRQLLALRDAVRGGQFDGDVHEMARQVRALLERVPMTQPEKVWPPETTQAYKILPLWNQGVSAFEIGKQLKIPMDNAATAASAWRAKGARVLDRRERLRATDLLRSGKHPSGTDFAALFDSEGTPAAAPAGRSGESALPPPQKPKPAAKTPKRESADKPPAAPPKQRTVAETASGLNSEARTIGMAFDRMVFDPMVFVPQASPRMLLLERLADAVRRTSIVTTDGVSIAEHMAFCRGIVDAIDTLDGTSPERGTRKP